MVRKNDQNINYCVSHVEFIPKKKTQRRGNQ